MKIVCIGDAMIPGENFHKAATELGDHNIVSSNWISDWEQLQSRRLVVEQQGPEVEDVPEAFLNNKDADMLLGLFSPFSEQAMDSFENLKLIGVARAGTENVNIPAATERGILVVNVMGRNAEAVSDYAVGMMLSESRNIARAHHAIKSGNWRKEFTNSAHVPELKGKTIGIIGLGYIGRLVAKKLSGFGVKLIGFDPWIGEKDAKEAGVELVDKETLFSHADFTTVHARLTEESHHLVDYEELGRMKPTSYFINTARSGLVNTDALAAALKEKKIAGAALDVFDIEPIPEDSPLLDLDNITLTTHIAGTTSEALSRSPYLLVDEIRKVLDGEGSKMVKNPEVLDEPKVKEWLHSLNSTVNNPS
ncbi:2-hydroxyacid dehydrogenase [Pseudalkalibacillus caeni]|uniref:3-phosphoglycerate dehydrogenase n=1 Tax=Exobacillus caeni TaxID=2574798 RepID=A0A5R9F4I1_9BACL|nr:2-hydroxyacid dehydrogenase [Pseudalkalibacillus caeni]TLS38437.1 3-phosphoglycerate dehydrogenase [Pseudalkalibacillus caeni]